VLDYVRERAGLPAFGRGERQWPSRREKRERQSSIGYALHLWCEARDLRGAPGETYLRRDRQLDYTDDLSHCLRWHEKLRALVALFRDIKTDEPRAVSRIFLDAEGHLKARLFIGPLKGCAVKIDSDENVTMGLHICEGVETALAARELGLAPVWALGSVGGIAKFPVLGGIEALTILAEEKDRKETHCAQDRAALRLASRAGEIFRGQR